MNRYRFLKARSSFALIVYLCGILTDAPADLYLTLKDESTRAELNCRTVRGAGDAQGFSCSNLPPSELLLINGDNLRFTRTSIGGWTFAAATDNSAGDSLYVEYGTCTPK